MDPADAKGLIELLNGGGNAAAIALVFIAWQVYKNAIRLLERIASGQEQIKRAIVARDPDAETHFREVESN